MARENEQQRFTILCVDDESAVLDAIVNDLREEYGRSYDVEGAISAAEAIEMVNLLEGAGREIALYIADQRMPDVGGVEFLAQVKDKWPTAKRAILTGYADKENAIEAINKARVYNYFVKPWESHKKDIFRAIDKLLLEYANDRIIGMQLASAQASINNIFKIALMSEQRDDKLRGHSIRVAIYSHYFGKNRGLQNHELVEICEHAFIHDIGLIAVPTMKFKNNPSKLEDEYSNPEEHTRKGEELLGKNPYFQQFLETIAYHHEYYSSFLSNRHHNAEASLYRRIITIADTIDYKAMRPDVVRQEVISIIKKMNEEEYNRKFDWEIITKITLPTIDLSNPLWKESKEFVLNLIKERGYLKLFDYDYTA